MTKILLHGANGAMGRVLRALLDAGFADCTAGPMVSRSGNGAFASFSEIRESADVVLDFSFHTATESALGFALEHGLPIVIGTTGHTQQERARIERASEHIPVFFSGNMSLGIAALRSLVREAALVCGRSGFSPRTHSEIGISSIRLGSVTGIHEVLISTGAETLSLKHEAHDRRLFAEGALRAAVFLCGRQPGLYDMDDLLKGDAL